MSELLQIYEPGHTPAPHEEADDDIAIGIDLGTTNSVVAWVDADNNVQIITDEETQSPLVPSIVAYGASGAVAVGWLAHQLLLRRPASVVSSVKRLMGRGMEDAIVRSLPLSLYDDEGDIKIDVAGHRLSPVEVSADILKAFPASRARAFAWHQSYSLVVGCSVPLFPLVILLLSSLLRHK